MSLRPLRLEPVVLVEPANLEEAAARAAGELAPGSGRWP